jgi:hypothetical protein
MSLLILIFQGNQKVNKIKHEVKLCYTNLPRVQSLQVKCV